MTLESEPSNPEPPNTNQVTDSDDDRETTEKLLEGYYEDKIDQNHPNLHVIWEIQRRT